MKVLFFVFLKRIPTWWSMTAMSKVSSIKKSFERKRKFYSPRGGLHRKGERGERKLSNLT